MASIIPPSEHQITEQAVSNSAPTSNDNDVAASTALTSHLHLVPTELEKVKQVNSELRKENTELKQANSDLLKENSELKQANSKLRKANSEIKQEVTNQNELIEKSEQNVAELSTTLENLRSLLFMLFESLRSISPAVFNYLYAYKDITFHLIDNDELKKIVNKIVECFERIDKGRRNAIRARETQCSKSERSKRVVRNNDSRKQAITDEKANDDPLETAIDKQQRAEQEQYDKQVAEDLDVGNGPKAEFGAKDKELLDNREALIQNVAFLNILDDHVRESPIPVKASGEKGKKGPAYRKEFKFDKKGPGHALDAVKPNIQNECCSEKKNSKQSSSSSVTDTVKAIDNATIVVEATADVVPCYCKCCNKDVVFKIIGVKQQKDTSHTNYNGKPTSSIVPSYKGECTRCGNTQVIDFTSIPTDKKRVHIAVNSDDLQHPAEQVLDQIQDLVKNKRGSGGIIEDLIDHYKEEKKSKFDRGEAEAKLNQCTDANFSTEKRKQIALKASDIKRQPHLQYDITGQAICQNDSAVLLGAIPPFKGSKATIWPFAMMLQGRYDYSSKSRVHAKLSSAHKAIESVTLSRSRFMELDIRVHRAFSHGIAKATRDKILTESTTIHLDETPVHVRSLDSQGYLWGVCTGLTSPVEYVYYAAKGDRSRKNIQSVIDFNSFDEGFKNIVTDGYAAYVAGFDSILGKPIVSACCWSHFRRALHQSFQEGDLLNIYNQLLPSGSKATDFIDNLQRYVESKDCKINNKEVLLLSIYYLINMIFANDAKVVDAHERHDTEEFVQELEKMRREHSSHLVAALDLLIEAYIAATNNIALTPKGKSYCNNGTVSKINTFTLYWKKFSDRLVEFLYSGHIPLTNNSIERAFRLVAIAKHVSLGCKTMDGFHCFADQMTIVANCALCNAPIAEYYCWAVTKIQDRVNALPTEVILKEQERLQELYGSNAKIKLERHRMPNKKSFSIIGDDGKEQKIEFDIYSEGNPTTAIYDLISYDGLTPQDFMRERAMFETGKARDPVEEGLAG